MPAAVNARTDESGFTKRASQAPAITSSPTEKISAFRGAISPVTIGRPFVRFMILSMSRSTYMFTALAPPAANVPPIIVATISQMPGRPRWATIIVGTVVISSWTIIRGFVRAT